MCCGARPNVLLLLRKLATLRGRSLAETVTKMPQAGGLVRGAACKNGEAEGRSPESCATVGLRSEAVFGFGFWLLSFCRAIGEAKNSFKNRLWQSGCSRGVVLVGAKLT